MRNLYLAHAHWSEDTFGTVAEKGPIGPLRHLIKEAQEAIEATHDASEFVDCLFLTFDAARRAGHSYEDLIAAGWTKLAVLKQRSYARDTSDNPVEHDRR